MPSRALQNQVAQTMQTETPPTSSVPILSAIRKPTLIGGVMLSVFVAIFFVWGGTAPLEGGANASGSISPEGSRRTVQHLEGGIIEDLVVREGDRVERGAILVRLRTTQAQASFAVLANQRALLMAQRARLQSEQANLDAIRFPESLTVEAEHNDEIGDILINQQELFLRRKELHENRQAIFSQRIGQLNAEIVGLREQIASQRIRLGYIDEEIEATQYLLERGLAPRPRLLALQREQASIQEQISANRAAIARAQQTIGEAEVQVLAGDSERLDNIINEINSVQAELSEVNERLLASGDILERTSIRAPISGTIANMRIRTESGVIRPGDAIMDIVPADEALIIEARLSPIDIDLVSIGQTAAVHLPALPQKNLPRIFGSVIYVSADTLTSEDDGAPYFLIRVRVDIDDLDMLSERIGENLRLSAGMPAEVLLVTGERTMLEYILQPLRNSLRNALRES